MHEYYAANRDKFKKGMDRFLSLVAPEIERASGKKYVEEIWDYYEERLLERFPYVGGDKVSGTRNLTGAYYFVAMGEVLKRYGLAMEEIGHIMVYAYERNTLKMPGPVRAIIFCVGKALHRRRRKTYEICGYACRNVAAVFRLMDGAGTSKAIAIMK